jgi:hypothetical protein
MGIYGIRTPRLLEPDAKGALAAIEQMQDWATWTSALLTGVLAGIATYFTGKRAERVRLSPFDVGTLTCALIWIGAALLIAGSVLSALPSLALRVSVECPSAGALHSAAFDVYERGLYARQDDGPCKGPISRFTVAYFLTLQHWLWGLGLVATGVLFVRNVHRSADEMGIYRGPSA